MFVGTADLKDFHTLQGMSCIQHGFRGYSSMKLHSAFGMRYVKYGIDVMVKCREDIYHQHERSYTPDHRL